MSDKWIAWDEGTYPTTITFKLASGVTDDGEGGEASGLTDVDIAVRLKLVSQSKSAQVQQIFPGTNNTQVLLFGWVGTEADHTTATFPDSLRGWLDFPVGDATFSGRAGKIECQVQPFVDANVAAEYGERFCARWTPS
ncbi:MAG: hypothetical protein AAGA46_03180 [Cyanobacteria bacterium P01_F01_bin.13]